MMFWLDLRSSPNKLIWTKNVRCHIQDYERGTQIASGIALGFVGDIDWHGEWTAAGNLMDRKSTYRVELNSPIIETRRNTEEM
jgi:hypothetical protein